MLTKFFTRFSKNRSMAFLSTGVECVRCQYPKTQTSRRPPLVRRYIRVRQLLVTDPGINRISWNGNTIRSGTGGGGKRRKLCRIFREN